MNEPENDGATADLERRVAADLSSWLEGLPVGAEFSVEPTAEVCASLELYIPRLLQEKYEQWKRESLDGVRVACAYKTGPNAARIGGTCILITDQSVTPFLLEAVASSSGQALESFRVCVGEAGDGPLGISGPDWGSSESAILSATIADRIDNVDWSFEVQRDDI